MSQGSPTIREEVFTGALSGFAGLLVHSDLRRSVRADTLLDADCLMPLLKRHHESAGGDCRAASSYWTQVYFRTLIVPAVATVLLGRVPVASGLRDLRFVPCPERAVPLSFVRLSTPPPLSTAECLASLLDDHLAPLIPAVCRTARLSQTMVWENAAWPLAFALRHAIDRRPACAAAVETMLAWPACPQAAQAAQAALSAVRSTALDGAAFVRRRCCLRNRVPGMGRCADQCPMTDPQTVS